MCLASSTSARLVEGFLVYIHLKIIDKALRDWYNSYYYSEEE